MLLVKGCLPAAAEDRKASPEFFDSARIGPEEETLVAMNQAYQA
jgi:hypothetical protein